MVAQQGAGNIQHIKGRHQPFLLCENEQCEFHVRPILLPGTGLAIRFSDRKQLAKVDWQAAVACPIAGHVSVYKQSDIHWLDQQDRAPDPDLLDWFSVEIECAAKDCGALVTLHISSPVGATNTLNLPNLLATKVAYSGKLPCGHYFVPKRKEACHPQRGWIE